MIDTLIQPFQFAFMNSAFLIMAMISVPMALLSCYLVLKGWSLMGDAISHAVLPGVVLAYMLHIPLIIGAFCAGMFCALATGFLKENSRVKQDTVMGIVFCNMLGVGTQDLWTAGLIALAVTVVILAKRRDFMLHAFDPIQAQAVGLPVRWLHYGLLAMMSLTIVATLTAVGIILSIGLLIAPGAIAFLVTKRFDRMLMVAVGATQVSGFVGVYLSFYIDSAPAPTVILIMTALFIGAFVYSTRRTRAQSEVAG